MIKVESLDIQKMLQESPRRRSQNIADAGWRQFLTYLAYKCEYMGKILMKAPKYFASTQRCNKCGQLKKMDLKERVYHCDCGYSCDRDLNAAKNLHAVGITV